jgi:hypothetical protein
MKTKMKMFFTKKRYCGKYPQFKKIMLIATFILIDSYIIVNTAMAFSPLIPKAEWVKINNGASRQSSSKIPETSKEKVSEDNERSVMSIEDKIISTFGKDGQVALAIAKSESGLNPLAIGDLPIIFLRNNQLMGMSCGLFQIRVLEGRPDCKKLQDIDTNIEWAKKLYDDSNGFIPWSNYKNLKYLNFLNK